MEIKIALAGNPNCGKTTLFNALTGSNQYVGNWPGVTVEKKEGQVRHRKDVTLVDLPGIYSLSPYTLEEVVARRYLLEERPDAILNIVDGTNLERNLYLSTQLAELGIPMVIAINMMDVVAKKGDEINIGKLSRELGCEVVEISALKSSGIEEAADAAIRAAREGKPKPMYVFSGRVEHTLAHIEEVTVHNYPEYIQRWYAIKIFERDREVLEKLALPKSILDHVECDIKGLEDDMDDDSEGIITNERYVYIGSLVERCCVKHSAGKLSLSDKIDLVATNRWAALPLFAAIMFLVYFLSIGSVGSFTVTFMNDGLFGSFAETYPGTFVENWISVPDLFDLVLLKDGALAVAPWLYSLIQDGIVGGVGSVLGFVPQMIVLFLLLSLLEDCGYMSRVAFIMDKIFRKFGLSGKSFIPMLVGSGCSVPGIMASRTIESERDRRITVMTTAFIPCGAKMPLIGMIAGAMFGGTPGAKALISVAAYFIGVASVVVSGIILKKFRALSGDPAAFIMELPSYHAPLAKNIFRTTWDRGWSFIKRAGTVIFAASVIIWLLGSFSFTGGIHYITDTRGGISVLEAIGMGVAWIFAPLGFGNWQSAVATLLGLVAKEEIVGAFGAMAGSESGVYSYVASEVFAGSVLAAFSFMVFNLLCAPCFAAMGAIKREMNSGKWTAAAIGYMCAFAYATSFCIYNIGSVISGEFYWWEPITFAISLAVIGLAIYLLIRPAASVRTKAVSTEAQGEITGSSKATDKDTTAGNNTTDNTATDVDALADSGSSLPENTTKIDTVEV